MPEKFQSIIEEVANEFPLTFEFLRKQGIDFLQVLSQQKWTDFNLHDPGITILEQLCFALTDLSYRTEFPVEDILAGKKDGNINREDNSFIPPAEALTSKPITANDFRKYLIDEVKEVSNAWVQEILLTGNNHYLRGLYKVIVHADYQNAASREAVRTEIKKKLASARNIGQDFEEITFLENLEINIKAEIIITIEARPEEILANIYHTITNFLANNIAYSTEKELIAKGQTTEEMYTGPLLVNGIIADSALKEYNREIDPFRLAQKLLTNVNEVASIKKLELVYNGTAYADRPVLLRENEIAYFNPWSDSNKVTLETNMIAVQFDINLSKKHFNQLTERSKKDFVRSVYQNEINIPLKGRYRDIEKYYSIQHFFPAVYGLGREGISQGDPVDKKAKVRQLKAYLMLFEQVLANYLSQLANIPKLFSPAHVDDPTYFFQTLGDVPRAGDIIKSTEGRNQEEVSKRKEQIDFSEGKANDYFNYLSSLVETGQQHDKRRESFLDHFLARFNVSVSFFAAFFFDHHYNRNSGHNSNLEWKAGLLRDVNKIIQNRVKARNYLHAADGPGEQDFEENIYRYMHIKSGPGSSLIHPAKKQAVVQIQESGHGDGANAKHGEGETNELRITNQGIAFLQTGIDINNYEIKKEHDGYIIIFRHEKEPAQIIHRRRYKHDEDATKWKTDAYNVLKKGIDSLRELSIRAEGFHLVEHLLLRPSLQSQSFGFWFFGKGNQPVFRNKEWVSFYERQALFDKAKYGNDAGGFSKNLEKHGKLYPTEPSSNTPREKPDGKNITAKAVCDCLGACLSDTNGNCSCLKYLVKSGDDFCLDEDFFNFRLTFVFPDWPARFQDDAFRDYTERLIRAFTPAHLNYSLHWLARNEMAHFETLFFPWREALANWHKSSSKEHRNHLDVRAEQVVLWLARRNDKHSTWKI